MKTCSKCKIEKSFDEFTKHSTSKNGIRPNCKDCQKEYREKNKEKIKKWYQENKEHLIKYSKKRYEENKEYAKKYSKKYREENKKYYSEYTKQRRNTEPLFKFSCNVRTLIGNSFKRGTNQFTKKAKSEKILCCTIEEFTLFIKSKFIEGMTLENYGQWHLDHIIPLDSAKSEEEIIKLNHYTNFQPLWAEENIRKGNRLDY
jgi:tRNA nucleotidyltransferase/poly(A) polymerase